MLSYVSMEKPASFKPGPNNLFIQNEKLMYYPLKMAKLAYVYKENKQQLTLSSDMNGLDCVLVEEYGKGAAGRR